MKSSDIMEYVTHQGKRLTLSPTPFLLSPALSGIGKDDHGPPTMVHCSAGVSPSYTPIRLLTDEQLSEEGLSRPALSLSTTYLPSSLAFTSRPALPQTTPPLSHWPGFVAICIIQRPTSISHPVSSLTRPALYGSSSLSCMPTSVCG